MQFHSTKCVFLGYFDNHKGFKCMSRQGRTYISRHVMFDHSEFPYPTLFKYQENTSTDPFSFPSIHLTPNISSNSASPTGNNISDSSLATTHSGSTSPSRFAPSPHSTSFAPNHNFIIPNQSLSSSKYRSTRYPLPNMVNAGVASSP